MTETRSRSSAGIPSVGDDPAPSLEDRLGRLEARMNLRDRGRDVLDTVMPPEASRHFRNAGREHLLGIRSMVDHWIGRIDAMESRAAGPDASRETIRID
jgi:hypothetical protein